MKMNNSLLCFFSTLFVISVFSQSPCTDDSFKTAKGTCYKCNDTRNGGLSFCTSCSFVPLGGLLECKKCRDGYFLNPVSRDCLPCHSSCLTCSSEKENSCLTCPKGKFKFQRISDGGSDNKCNDCPANCDTCYNHGQANQTLTDENINDLSCSVCQEGYFPSMNKTTLTTHCTKCQTGCQKCVAGDHGALASVCLACPLGQIGNWEGKCVGNCGKERLGFFRDFNTKMCSPVGPPVLGQATSSLFESYLNLDSPNIPLENLCVQPGVNGTGRHDVNVGAIILISRSPNIKGDLDLTLKEKIKIASKKTDSFESSSTVLINSTEILIYLPEISTGKVDLGEVRTWRGNISLKYVCINSYNLFSQQRLVSIRGKLNKQAIFRFKFNRNLSPDELNNLTCSISAAVFGIDEIGKAKYFLLKNHLAESCVLPASVSSFRYLRKSANASDIFFIIDADQYNGNASLNYLSREPLIRESLKNFVRTFKVFLLQELTSAELDFTLNNPNTISTNNNITGKMILAINYSVPESKSNIYTSVQRTLLSNNVSVYPPSSQNGSGSEDDPDKTPGAIAGIVIFMILLIIGLIGGYAAEKGKFCEGFWYALSFALMIIITLGVFLICYCLYTVKVASETYERNRITVMSTNS